MLQQLFKVREQMVWFKSGHFYSFNYTQYKNDPIPTVIMLNAVKGTHPNTGHIHNYIQAINLSYIPRNYRKRFVELWQRVLERNNGNVRLTWHMVSARWPFMKFAIRRYLLQKNYIRYAKEIKDEDIQTEVISTWLRDYSQSAMKQLMILNAKIREQNPKYHKNTFMKSLSKYLTKYRLSR